MTKNYNPYTILDLKSIVLLTDYRFRWQRAPDGAWPELERQHGSVLVFAPSYLDLCSDIYESSGVSGMEANRSSKR